MNDATFQGKVSAFTPTDKGAELDFNGTTIDEVAELLGTFFAQNNFRLESGTATQGTYGSGSTLGRIAGGGFAGRKKYDVSVNGSGPTVHASVASGMSGMSGGVLGVVKERKQRQRLVESLRSYVV